MRIVSLIAALATAISTVAHSVWIEPNAEGQLIIRFAEPDGKFEKSPGHLDELEIPMAWAQSEKGPVRLEVQKKRDHFLLVGANPSQSVQVQTHFQVLSSTNRPGRLPNFYARWSPAAASANKPANTFDLVPASEPGVARVYFRGKPLGGVTATYRTPDEKEVKLTADAEGNLRFNSSQAGLHMLSVAHHRETLPGFAGGKSYDLTSHNTALSWQQK